jgi:hypothetical protein
VTGGDTGYGSDALASSLRAEPNFGTIAIPLRPEDFFAFRQADWNWIRGRVTKLKNPLPYIGQVGWTSIGFGAGALLAVGPWLASYGQLPRAGHQRFAWVAPAMIITGIVTAIIAAICLAASKR